MRAQKLHAQAMEIADAADTVKRLSAGRDKAIGLLKESFLLEKQAALLVTAEPSRSVLLRSAASLAMEVGFFRQAEQLIGLALSGEPPAEIAEELRDMMEEVHFKRHLDLRGMKMHEGEIRMSIAGKAISPGLAKFDQFAKRMDEFARVITRTAERELKQDFRESGEPSKVTRSEIELYVAAPLQAASLAVSFRVARPKQSILFPDTSPGAVVEEVIECLRLLNDRKDEALRERIEDDSYYNNFISLARSVAPDGDAVSIVAFTHVVAGAALRELPMTRLAKSIAPFVRDQASVPTEAIIWGTLNYADDTQRKSGLIQVGGKKIRVPKGLMADLVGPHWDRRVIATCIVEGDAVPTLVDMVSQPPPSDDEPPEL